MMLSNLVKQHTARQQARKELQDKRKRDAIVAATALSHVLVDHLNAGVAQAYVNQKKLDTETRILQANATQFSKQTMQWLKLVEDFNTALKPDSKLVSSEDEVWDLNDVSDVSDDKNVSFNGSLNASNTHVFIG
ncbi:biogenesis of lysosome- organelles complex 1 subunit 1 [Bulinus truncatus]|nr:biogenesis of lysosome- organelles complex 1 subunit 1 [Bulinus truncatus]